MMIGCHVCVTVCACAWGTMGLCCKIAPQSTAVQKDDAPKTWSFTTLPTMQCKVVDKSIATEVKMRGKQLVWMLTPHPLKKEKRFFFVFFVFSSQLQVPLSFSLLCHKRENKRKRYACVDDGKALLWHIVIMALGNHTAVALCVCAGKEKFQVWALRWDETGKEKERESVYRRKAPRVIRYEIFIMW